MKHKNKNKRKIGKIWLLLALVLVVILVSFLVVNRDNLTIDGLKRSISYRNLGESSLAETFSYAAGKEGSFGAFGGGLVVAGRSGFTYYDKSGKAALSDEVSMSDPVLSTGGSYGMVYDLGGTDLRVFDKQDIIYEVTADNKIISAQMNQNGWAAVCTEGTDANGVVTVYNSTGEAVYEWYSRTGYLVSAAVSPDDKHMSVLTMTGEGSRIVGFDLGSDEEQGEYIAEESLIFSIMYTSAGTVLALAEDSVVYLDKSVQLVTSYEYESSYLRSFAFDDVLALYLGDTGSGSTGRLVLLGEKGELLGEEQASRGVISMSVSGKYLGVLYDDGLEIYRGSLTLYHDTEDADGMDAVIMRSDGTALLIGSYQATLYIP